jgi:hypothetical protein
MGCMIRVGVRFAALRHNKAVIHLAPHDEFLEPALLILKHDPDAVCVFSLPCRLDDKRTKIWPARQGQGV